MALLAKLNWRFHSEDNASWAKVLKLKYGTRQRLNSKKPSYRKKGEHVFKDI